MSRNINKSNNAFGSIKSGSSSEHVTGHKSDIYKKDPQKPQTGQISSTHQTSAFDRCNGLFPIDQVIKNSACHAERVPIAECGQKAAATFSPSPAAGMPLLQMLPPSGYDDFLVSMNSVYEPSLDSPCFIDWQSNMAFPYNAKLDASFISPDFACDSDFLKIYQTDDIMNLLPDLSTSTTIIQTPLMTPKMDNFHLMNENFDLSPSDKYSCARSSNGLPVDDLESIITARDAWSGFRSSPALPQILCPRTAKLHLDSLEHSLKDYEMWNAWRINANVIEPAISGPEVIPIQEGHRDKLSAITQAFLNKALEIHKANNTETSITRMSDGSTNSNSIVLPPACVLEQFLAAYASNFEPYFPLAFRARLDVNESLTHCNENASSVLILIMLCLGATAFYSVETLSLVGGLTEICRISLSDLIEKNVMLSADLTVLQSALLLTHQAAWSGDKWQMDIAMGQRGMYISILRRVVSLAHDELGSGCGQGLAESETWLHWSKLEMGSRYVVQRIRHQAFYRLMRM